MMAFPSDGSEECMQHHESGDPWQYPDTGNGEERSCEACNPTTSTG